MHTWNIVWYPTPTEKVTFNNCTGIEYERAGGGTTFLCDDKWQHLKGGAIHLIRTS